MVKASGLCNKLSSADKILVTLYLDDIEYSEISLITGLSEGNARARIHRIKKQIKKDWEDKYSNHGRIKWSEMTSTQDARPSGASMEDYAEWIIPLTR